MEMYQSKEWSGTDDCRYKVQMILVYYPLMF